MKNKMVAVVSVLVMVLAFSVTVLAEPLTLWHTVMVNESAMREPTVETFESATQLNVRSDYGPALYRDVAQRFMIQGRTGTPDVIEGTLEQMFSYHKAGLLMDITEQFYNSDQAQYYAQNALDALTIDGKLYGVPYTTNVRLLLYRESVFAEYGLDVPETWDELVETAAWISDNVPGMQGFMFTTRSQEVRAFQEFMSFYFQLNRNMFDTSGEVVEVVATPEQLGQVLTLYHDMFFEGGIDLNSRGGDWKALDYGYTGGQIAMVTVGPWIWGHRTEDPAAGDVLDDTGIVGIPVAENGTPGTYMEVKPIMLNAHTKDVEGAFDLLEEASTKELQLAILTVSGSLSPRSDVMEEPIMADNWWTSGFGEYAHTGVALEGVAWERPQEAIIDAIQMSIYEQMTPEEAGQWLFDELVSMSGQL